ncbi:hypothetical protein BH10PSE13_BH10PSE13_11890 [soil metagenome]
MRKTKLLLSIAALAISGWSSAALADDSGIGLHGFGDISLKTDYVTPRGLVVTTSGATIQVLNGLVLTTPMGVTFHAGTWVDLNPGFSRKDGNITAVNELDWFVGVDGNIAKNLNLGVEFSQFISGQPSVAFKRESNIEFALKYSDNPTGTFSINPYAKLFWAVSSKSSTVVLGKAGKTFDVELGAVPTYKGKGFSLSAPTWVTVGPESYWGRGGSALTKPDGNVGVFSTGLKGAVPLSFLSSTGARASIYVQVQYYNLINDNLLRAKGLLNSGASNRDHVVFATGLNFGF